MKKLHIFLLGIFFLLVFMVFSRAVKRGAMKEADFSVTIKVQERIDHSTRLRLARLTGEIMEGSSFLASPLSSIIVIIFITIITCIKRKKWRLAALLIPLAFGLMTLAEVYGKSVVHHPAPPFFLLKNPNAIFPRYYVWEDFSYPSGHAARAVFLSIILYGVTKKRNTIGIVLAIYIGLVSLSRIYLGHHWLSDVIGGILVGAGSGLLTSALLLPYNRNRHE